MLTTSELGSLKLEPVSSVVPISSMYRKSLNAGEPLQDPGRLLFRNY